MGRNVRCLCTIVARDHGFGGLVPVDLRVTLLGIKVDQPTSEEAFNELHLTDLFIGEGLSATVALVRIRRDDLPPKEDLLAQAERFL